MVRFSKNQEDSVSLKDGAPPLLDDESFILFFWKTQRQYFKTQLFELRRAKFGTPPLTPTQSELLAEAQASMLAEKWPIVVQGIEKWVSDLPGRFATPSPPFVVT